MGEGIPFGSSEYLILLAGLLFARGMDFLSTWVATPNLTLEGNPIARKMGWKVGLIFNAALCAVFALWPLPAVVIATTSLLVAARNFQSAWLMRTMGEDRYRHWISNELAKTPPLIYHGCLLGQSLLTASVGGLLIWSSKMHLMPFAVGVGIITYAAAVLVYSLLSVWRFHRG